MNEDEITIQYEGKTIRGRFTYLKINEFGIQMVEPMSELYSSSAHIPVFALSVTRFTDNGKITDYCRQRAETMLRNLYIDNMFLEENKEKFDTCIKELAPDFLLVNMIIDQEVENFRATRRELKKKFKNNEIGEKEYTSILRKRRNDERYEIIATYDIISESAEKLL
jgi:glycerol-3-phosphate cytidylyltransferase-like family protein